MLKPYLLFALAASILWTGCSTIRVSNDYDTNVDFTGMRTFAWEKETQPKTGDIRLDDELEDKRIRSAVEQILEIKGYEKTDRPSADFLVAYKLGIQQKIRTDPVQTGFGFGFGRRGHYGGIGISTGSDVQTYEEGMLFIDVLDPDNGALLWRGKGTDIVSTHMDREKRNQRIREAVEKILAQFPP